MIKEPASLNTRVREFLKENHGKLNSVDLKAAFPEASPATLRQYKSKYRKEIGQPGKPGRRKGDAA